VRQRPAIPVGQGRWELLWGEGLALDWGQGEAAVSLVSTGVTESLAGDRESQPAKNNKIKIERIAITMCEIFMDSLFLKSQ
jgi:hypothetical protein